MDQPISNASTPPVTPPSTSGAQSPPHNPYQRIASRRAIACVTCAKAKTKCDKGLPCCSRCISKGIKCEPRSTRRTSENSYRPTLKKPFVTPKRYNSTSAMSSFNRHASPRSILTSKSRPMRAASHIDFRTAVKMSQQASNLSGFPTLTPLPTTYNNQTSDASGMDTNSADHQSVECTPAFEAGSMLMSGSLTPQTPESVMYHEPVSLMDTPEQWISSQVWPDDSLAPMGLGLECEMSSMVPADLWSLSDSMHPLPITQLGWDQSQPSISPQSMSSELMPDCGSVPPLSLGDYSVDDLNPTSDLHNNWGNFQFAPCDSQMTSVMSTPSFVPDFTSYPGTAVPTWEDVFIPGPAPY